MDMVNVPIFFSTLHATTYHVLQVHVKKQKNTQLENEKKHKTGKVNEKNTKLEK